MHSDGNMVTEGVTEAVTGHAVSGRAAHNATNGSQALNKKVSILHILLFVASLCSLKAPAPVLSTSAATHTCFSVYVTAHLYLL